MSPRELFPAHGQKLRAHEYWYRLLFVVVLAVFFDLDEHRLIPKAARAAPRR